jgi:hypothetical protein
VSDAAPPEHPDPEIAGIQIVLVGDFNPAIIQPSWLALSELVRPEEADAAEVGIVSRELTQFALPWVTIAATLDRFELASARAPTYEQVRDLAIGIFTVLDQTPIRAMGMNRNQHFRTESEDRWHAYGHALTPKEIWEDVLDAPGMRSLIMQGKRTDGREGYINVTVEPSVRLQDGTGIYISINDHFQLDAMDKASTQGMIEVLSDSWDAAARLSDAIVDRLLRVA